MNGIIGAVSGEDSEVARLIASGDQQEAATLLYSTISSLNVPSDVYIGCFAECQALKVQVGHLMIFL